MSATRIYKVLCAAQVRIIDEVTTFPPPPLNDNRRPPVDAGLIPCAQNRAGRVPSQHVKGPAQPPIARHTRSCSQGIRSSRTSLL